MLKERGDSMAINDNTTRLGSSFSADSPRITARDFDDYTAKSISQSVAKANYRKSFKSDFKVAELRRYVYKMVTSWSEADKKAILAQYGSSDAARGGKLDEAVTETLIINLKETDLQTILNDIRGDEANLSKKVRDIRQMKRREASKFSTRTFGEVFEGIKDVRKTRDITKELRKYDKGFKIPKNVRNAFPRLKKELMELVPLVYDRVEIAILANKMGLTIDEGAKEKEVINMIVNKTLLYVALITGKTKSAFSGAILDPEPFKELLGYTSYSWVSGRSGISTGGLKSLRDEAIAAKQMAKLQFTQKRGKPNIFQKIGKGIATTAGVAGNVLASPLTLIPAMFSGLFGSINDKIVGRKTDIAGDPEKSAFFKALTPFTGRSDQEILERKARSTSKSKLDQIVFKKENRESLTDEEERTQSRFNELNELTDGKLLDVGEKLGLKASNISGKDGKKRKKYIEEILAKEEIPSIRKKALEEKKERVAKRGKLAAFFGGGRKLSAEEQAELATFEDSEKEKKEKELSGTKIPYVKLKAVPSEPNFKSIADFAVPVWVINAGQISGAEPIAPTTGVPDTAIPQISPVDIPKKSLSGSFLDLIRSMGKKASESGVTPSESPTAAAESALAGPSEMDTRLAVSSRNSGREFDGKRNYTKFFELAKPFLPQGYTTKLGKDGEVVEVRINGKYVKKGELAKIAEQGGAYSSKGGGTTIPALAGIEISSLIDNKLKSKGYKTAKNEPITPVYVTNQSLPTDAGKLILGLARILLRILVPVGGGLIADQLDAMASGTGGVDQLLEMAGLATGGKGRAVGSLAKKTTHFISGDSLNKKPNPEQVSVNWANKSYTVKPIPQFAEGGGQSASGQITRMTSTERNKPMSVGISSHLVTYNRELQGASDNGDKQALKVYAVNPGITDMVDVNGSNVSLIGLVSDAVIRLSNIEGLLSVNNQQNDATIAATSAVAANISRLKSSSSGKGGMNPFAGGFPSDLDEILTGV
jgi:hypothetical protein